jgi:hypothetical protein
VLDVRKLCVFSNFPKISDIRFIMQQAPAKQKQTKLDTIEEFGKKKNFYLYMIFVYDYL